MFLLRYIFRVIGGISYIALYCVGDDNGVFSRLRVFLSLVRGFVRQKKILYLIGALSFLSSFYAFFKKRYFMFSCFWSFVSYFLPFILFISYLLFLISYFLLSTSYLPFIFCLLALEPSISLAI